MLGKRYSILTTFLSISVLLVAMNFLVLHPYPLNFNFAPKLKKIFQKVNKRKLCPETLKIRNFEA